MFTERVLALAGQAAPTAQDVSFPTQSDLAGKTWLLQVPSDTSFVRSDKARAEMDALPAMSRLAIGRHLDAANSCIMVNDWRGCTQHINRAIAVARLNDAHHLRQELADQREDIARQANKTHEADGAPNPVRRPPTSDQSSYAINDNPANGMSFTALSSVLALAHPYERVEHGREERVGGYMSARHGAEHYVSPQGDHGMIRNGVPHIAPAGGGAMEAVESHWTQTMRSSWHPASEDGYRLEHAGTGHLQVLRQAVSGKTTGMLSPAHYGLLEGEGRKAMYSPEHGNTRALVGQHLARAAEAIHAGDLRETSDRLSSAANHASAGGMRETAAQLFAHLASLHREHPHMMSPEYHGIGPGSPGYRE